MKTYIELAEEALRQRDAYIINRKKTIKKAVLSVSLVLVFAVFGGGAFIGISHLNAPETPPSVTTESEGTVAPTETFADTAEPAESDTVTDTAEPADPTGSTEDTAEPAETPAESSESEPTEQPTEEYTAPPTDTYTDTQTDVPRETDEPAEINTAEPQTEPQTEPQITETAPPATETDTDATDIGENGDTSPDTVTTDDLVNGNNNTNPRPVESGKEETPKEPNELWQTVTHSSVGTPRFWGEVPDILIPPISNGPEDTTTSSVYIQTPSKVYYSTEFDYPDFFFLKDGTGSTVLPNYCVDKSNTPTAKEQTERFLELLYGENVPFMGEFTYTGDEVVYFTWDDAIVESGVGKFIAADSYGKKIYFTVDLANPETVGGGYRDMTHAEAFEYISRSAYYKAAAELLGLSDPMVMTEIHRYYSGNLYEYRFTVTERADGLGTALYNLASANVEIEMRYYPDYGVIRVYFVINYPVALTFDGYVEFYSYSEKMEMLSAAYEKRGYSASYAERTLLTFKSIRSSDGTLHPALRYHLGYNDTDGAVRYVEIEVKMEK